MMNFPPFDDVVRPHELTRLSHTTMPTYARLIAVAYQRERSASRRLTLRAGMSSEQALRQTMTDMAGCQSLMELVCERERAVALTAAALAQRRSEKAAQRCARLAAAQPDPAAWLAWFDGACHPNPGKIGIGGLLRSPEGTLTEICRTAGHGDSNEAEYLALIAVLEAALEAGAHILAVHGDSRVVIDALMHAHPATHLREHSLRARALAAQLESVTMTWIPRHKNSAADALSQRAIGFFPAAGAP